MSADKSKWSENEEIKIFQEYLKIRTDHPVIDYGDYLFKFDENEVVDNVFFINFQNRASIFCCSRERTWSLIRKFFIHILRTSQSLC